MSGNFVPMALRRGSSKAAPHTSTLRAGNKIDSTALKGRVGIVGIGAGRSRRGGQPKLLPAAATPAEAG